MHYYHHFGGYTSPGCLRAVPRHHHFEGLKLVGMSTEYASPPPFRWAPPPPGFRRVMPRHSHFDGLHLGGMSTGYLAASEGRGGRRCPHWVQMIEPLIFGVGAEGEHIGST